MCLILFAYNVHPAYRLIVAANRDEFYERPSAPAEFWEGAPQVLAGRDLQGGGTWLGVTREGKIAAITNYRDPAAYRSGAPTRGKLVSDFLTGRQNASAYLKKISPQMKKYNGFNLILKDEKDLFVFSNRGEKLKLEPGIYGLSNHLLDTSWPKVAKGKKGMFTALDKKGAELEAALFTILSDKKIAPDHKLPATGIGLEWERILSSIFIKSPNYGTRSSTILLFGKNRRVKFIEKVFDGNPEPWVESRFSFLRDKGAN